VGINQVLILVLPHCEVVLAVEAVLWSFFCMHRPSHLLQIVTITFKTGISSERPSSAFLLTVLSWFLLS
jgi:hypothetical protein